MAVISLDELLLQIGGRVDEGKVALFLGAGASSGSGVPLGPELAGLIKSKFPKIETCSNDVIEVCQEVIDTPPYDRVQLEKYISDILIKCQPSDTHFNMTKYNWAALFTTNYDDLIELAYRSSRSSSNCTKKCQKHVEQNFSIYTSDKDTIHLFKIMGCVQEKATGEGAMILSRADYNRALVRRRKYLEILRDMIKNGIVIFIGYSFEDRIVFDIIDEIKETLPEDCLPWSYVLAPQFDITEKIEHKFNRRKIIPVQGSFEVFIQKMGEMESQPHLRHSDCHHIPLFGHEIEIRDNEEKNYSEYFEVLTSELVNTSDTERDDFFRGNMEWKGFCEGWDFVRDIYYDTNCDYLKRNNKKCLRDTISEELDNKQSSRIILLTGMPGVGKTMMLKRIAYDAYKEKTAPVILINNLSSAFDYKLLASFIENLNKAYDVVSENNRVKEVKPLIIIDDAASSNRFINYLKNYLDSRGRNSLIIVAERKGDWQAAEIKYLFKYDDKDIYELDENLNQNEKLRIVQHLYFLGYIVHKNQIWDNIIEKEYQDSFFATVYSLVDPSKRPLDKIIHDQYMKLGDKSKKAFEYICCFQQYNLPLNQELLVRSLEISYENFNSEIISNDVIKIIFEERDKFGNILYKTHHRIIAYKTISLFFGDPVVQKDMLVNILKHAIPSNKKEKEIVENLLVNHIGPNAKCSIFSTDQKREIFKVACESLQLRSLYHHWGILESDNKNYSVAENLLKNALELPYRYGVEHEESDHTILNSLGVVYSRVAIDNSHNNPAMANTYFKKAGKRSLKKPYFM